MRFMLMVRANQDSESGKMPDPKLIEAMGAFNEEMVKAGVLLAGEGLHPSSQGARVKYSAGGKRTVVDGPFTETKELIAGYWILQVKSKEEAVQWALRAPAPFGEDHEGVVELRRIYELEDFAPGVVSPEEAARERRLRAEVENMNQ